MWFVVVKAYAETCRARWIPNGYDVTTVSNVVDLVALRYKLGPVVVEYFSAGSALIHL